MTPLQQTILLLAIASGNAGVAMRAVEPMLPRLADHFMVSIPVAGSAITAFAFSQAVGQYMHGPLGERYGALRVVTSLMVMAAIGSFGCAAAQSLDQLVVLRFLTGMFSAGTMTLGMVYIAERVPAETRQPVLARFLAGTITGQALGPFVGGVLTDLMDWRSAFIALGVVFAVVAVVLFVRTRHEWPAPRHTGAPLWSPRRYLELLRRPRVRNVMGSVFVEMIFFNGAFAFLGALLKVRFDLAFTTIGLILAGFGLGGLVYSTQARWMLARFGQRGCMLVGGTIGGASILVVAFSPWWETAMVATIGMGLGFYLVHNTLQAKATEMAPESRASGMALFSMAWGGGQAAGVALMGACIAVFDHVPMLVVFAIGFTTFALVARERLGKL